MRVTFAFSTLVPLSVVFRWFGLNRPLLFERTKSSLGGDRQVPEINLGRVCNPEPAFTSQPVSEGCAMITETENIASAEGSATSCESRGSTNYVAWREHPGQRPGLLYLLRLREHRRLQQLRKKAGKMGFVTQL